MFKTDKNISAQAVVAANEISNIIRGKVDREKLFVASNAAAYMLYKAAKDGKPLSFDDFVKGRVKTAGNVGILIPNVLTQPLWDSLVSLASRYSPDVFAAILLSDSLEGDHDARFDLTTPNSLCDLCLELLAAKKGDALLDLGSGEASMLLAALRNSVAVDYYGFDTSSICHEVASMRHELSGMAGKIQQKDIFDLVGRDAERFLPKVPSRKVFASLPIGIRLNESGCPFVAEISECCPDFSRPANTEWVYGELVTRLMGEKGRGVGLFVNGSLFSVNGKGVRKYFVDRGLVECVISLPPRLFESTGVSFAIVIFSHGNKSVRFVNAETLCVAGRRRNMFSAENIRDIVKLASKGGEHSVELSNEKIAENGYLLTPVQYTEYHEEKGTRLEEVIQKYTRGAPCTAAELDSMASVEPTDCQYLMLANIKNGIVSSDLPYLNGVDKSLEKYCIKDHSLIMSKNGYPYKIAVVDVEKGKSILANGNLYVVELDEEKADPYYVKAYFESSLGTAALKRITTGSVIPTIKFEQLKNLRIPLPSLKQQKEFVARYRKGVANIEKLRVQLAKALDDLNTMFESEAKSC